MSSIRVPVSIAVAVASVLWVLQARPFTQTQPQTPAVVGVWTLNNDLSDKPQAPAEGGDRGRGGRGGYGGGGRGGGRGGGGGGRGGIRGGGGFGPAGGGYGGSGRGNPDDMRRMRDAMRDIVEAPARMTITATESMVIITTGEGLTTRLSTDGTKIKDQSTGIERKSRWEGGKLVSEISGAASGKVTQTYAVDPDQPHLTLTLQFEGGNNARPPVKHVYDKEQ